MLDDITLLSDQETQDEIMFIGSEEERKLHRLLNLVTTIRACHVDFAHLREIRADFRNLLARDNESSEGSVIALFGASRSGKSKLLLDFQAECEALDQQLGNITLRNGDWARRRTYVQVNVPDSSMKTLMERLHSELNEHQKTTRRLRRFDYEEEIDYFCKERRVRVIAFDEVHQGIASTKSRARSAWEVAQKIKDFTNRGDRSIILSGTEEAEALLLANKELASRCHVIHRLLPLNWERGRDRQECKQLLEAYDQQLEKTVFSKHSDLAEDDLAFRIYVAAGGVIGQMATLVEIAAKKAVYDLVEGKADRVLKRHFELAFEKWAFGRERSNPFSTQKGSVVEATAPVIKRSSRRAGRDRDFRS